MKEMPQANLLSLSIENSILNIQLNRPEKYNALNPELIDQLTEVFEWSAHHSVGYNQSLYDEHGNHNFRILIVSGAGKHFCAGADINMMRDAGAKSIEENRADSEKLDRLFNQLWSHPCFTIGLIQGVALGGGAGLIACMDHVIMTKTAKIALSEGKLGILPAVIGPYVYRRVGSANFRRLAMMAGRIGAEESLRICMVEQIVDTLEEFSECVDSLTREVLSTGPCAVTSAKELTIGFDRWHLDDKALREWTLDYTSKMRGSMEGQEGLSSFLEKRAPNWKLEE